VYNRRASPGAKVLRPVGIKKFFEPGGRLLAQGIQKRFRQKGLRLKSKLGIPNEKRRVSKTVRGIQKRLAVEPLFKRFFEELFTLPCYRKDFSLAVPGREGDRKRFADFRRQGKLDRLSATGPFQKACRLFLLDEIEGFVEKRGP
jgi:hypothetical protein